VGCWRGEFLNDRDAAEQARKQFEAIGAQRGVQRAEAVLRRLGVRVKAHPDRGQDALSPREMQVAELVAEGMSNPVIARRLYLGRPTVATHVAHILAKLGFSSRTQIAAWVTQRRVILMDLSGSGCTKLQFRDADLEGGHRRRRAAEGPAAVGAGAQQGPKARRTARPPRGKA
jgi:DNA-binding CsgD family transcriptional regulator